MRVINYRFIRKIPTFLLCGGVLLFGYVVLKSLSFPEKKKIPTEVKYNLIEETNGKIPVVKDCTIEYANTHRLQQDHPCVLELIRKRSREPFPRNEPYGLLDMGTRDPSAGQSKAIMRLLNYKTNGVFVECGASDGDYLSNTLYLERFKNWTGLLIEPDPGSFLTLLYHKRKSWHIPACLSLEMYPTQVKFKSNYIMSSIQENLDKKEHLSDITTVQCFPFYSILLAHGRTSIDFFSLDVEGHELKVLKTIPWHKIDVKTLTVEWKHVKEGQEAIIDFMKQNGFVYFGNIDTNGAKDLVFVQDYLRDLRSDYVDYYEAET